MQFGRRRDSAATTTVTGHARAREKGIRTFHRAGEENAKNPPRSSYLTGKLPQGKTPDGRNLALPRVIQHTVKSPWHALGHQSAGGPMSTVMSRSWKALGPIRDVTLR